MLIENMMYFALGLLVAGLLALVIMPAVWKRAVRLTKRRIEAATPITLSEFRADKDQLRAEYALTIRRLEMNVETLRKRLAEQLSDANLKRADLGAIKAEREQYAVAVADFENRQLEMRARIIELEKENTDLSQRLRMRERESEARQSEITELRAALRDSLPPAIAANDISLLGDYSEDIDRLATALAVERKRAAFLEDQARSLIEKLETTDRRSAEATAAIARMREALSPRPVSTEALTHAEASMVSAETRINALLADSAAPAARAHTRSDLLANQLSLEDELERLRRRIGDVETSILDDWETEDFDEDQLRERLNDIAGSVSRLVYAVDNDAPLEEDNPEESLFDRVQRFADDGETMSTLEPPKPETRRRGSVSDRLAAVREIQGR